jgi:hypothetical protein
MTLGTWALGLSLALVWVGCSDDEDENIGSTGGAPGAGGANATGGVKDSGGAPSAEECLGIAGEASCDARGCNALTGFITYIAGELGGAGGGANGLDCGGGRGASAEFIGCVLGSGGATLVCHCQPGTDRCIELGPEVGWLEGWEPSEKCRACGGL